MTPSTGPDLAALREKAEAVIEHPSAATVREWWDERENLSAESLLAVLSLVDRLVAYSDHMASCPIAEKRPPGVCTCGYSALIDSLAGSPAANEETTDA